MCSTLRLAILVAIVGCAELITVKTPSKHVNVKAGEDILLECTFESTEADTTGLIITYEFAASTSTTPVQMFHHQLGKSMILEGYKDRLEPPSSPGTTKNVSVLLKDMQDTDSGLYTCSVTNFPDVQGESEVNIKVTVLEEPSIPFCSVRGNSNLGQNVTLACHSEHGSPTPTYNWTRNGQEQTKTSTGGKRKSTGTLVIGNVTESHYGTYRCTAKNAAGEAFCEIELHAGSTDSGTMDSNTAGTIAAIVIGVVLGCVLIGVSIWLIVRATNKKKYKGVQTTAGNEMGNVQ